MTEIRLVYQFKLEVCTLSIKFLENLSKVPLI